MTKNGKSAEPIPCTQSADFPDGYQEQDSWSYHSEILSIEELDSVANGEGPPLIHIVMTRYLRQERYNPDASDEERAQYAKQLGSLLDAYRGQLDADGAQSDADRDQKAGKWHIKDLYFCSYIPAAVVLKWRCPDNQEGGLIGHVRKFVKAVLLRTTPEANYSIETAYGPEAVRVTGEEIAAAMLKSGDLYLEAIQRRRHRRSILIQHTYFLIVDLLRAADAQAIAGGDAENAAKAASGASAQLSRLEESTKNAAETEARQDYLFGMAAGIIFLIALVWVLFQFTSERPAIQSALGPVVAGGLGAAVSVMTRLTANNLRVDADAGTGLIRLAGGFRPLVGAIFGLALYIFIEADLLPINLTVNEQKLTYFYLAAAFLAGFSERLAQDAITKAGAI